MSANTPVIPLSTDEDTVNIKHLFFIVDINSKEEKKENDQYFNFALQII